MENERISVEIEIIKGCYFSSKSLTFVNVKRKLVKNCLLDGVNEI